MYRQHDSQHDKFGLMPKVVDEFFGGGGGGGGSKPVAISTTSQQKYSSTSQKDVCIAKCTPELEKTPWGKDTNQWDFHKCVNDCMGKNG
jgi:hypothetical protein